MKLELYPEPSRDDHHTTARVPLHSQAPSRQAAHPRPSAATLGATGGLFAQAQLVQGTATAQQPRKESRRFHCLLLLPEPIATRRRLSPIANAKRQSRSDGFGRPWQLSPRSPSVSLILTLPPLRTLPSARPALC
jgi:hypothetical protein